MAQAIEKKKLDLNEALRLRIFKNYTYKEIADLQGVSRSTVSKAVGRIIEAVTDTKLNTSYRERKAEILLGAERVMLGDLLDPKAREKASLNNRAYAFKVLYDAGRLERGESTANVDVKTLNISITERDAKINALKDKCNAM